MVIKEDRTTDGKVYYICNTFYFDLDSHVKRKSIKEDEHTQLRIDNQLKHCYMQFIFSIRVIQIKIIGNIKGVRNMNIIIKKVRVVTV